MKPMLTIVPSYQRPHKVKPYAEAYLSNSSGLASVLFVLEEDDPYLEQYQKEIPDQFGMLVGKFGSYTKAINGAFGLHRNHAVYFVSADDFRHRTPGFEEKFIEELSDEVGIIYPNDLLQGENLPTQAAIHGDVARALGYLVYPEFTHLYVDDWWRELGKALPKYRYLPDVISEHMHPAAGKSPNDEIYQLRNSQGEYAHGQTVIGKLIADGLIQADADRVMEYINRVRS